MGEPALIPLCEQTDESLMALVREGSHQAFSLLVRRNTQRFYACAFRLCGNRSEAEDMVQEAFLKIWQKPSIWKEGRGAQFSTWFYRVLVNMNIDRLRRFSKTGWVDDAAIERMKDEREGAEESLVLTQEQKCLEKALGALPERQKTALTLCYYEGLSNAQAADVMGLKLKALESLLVRARAGVKEALADAQGQDKKEVRYGT